MGTRIIVSTNANVAAGAGTPKTILAYKPASGVAARITKFGVSFDGTSAVDARATVDFQKKPSTTGTSTDISSEIATIEGKTTQVGGAFQNFTAEPASDASTRILRAQLIPPTGTFETYADIALDPSEQIGLRVYGASGKNVRAWMEIELG